MHHQYFLAQINIPTNSKYFNNYDTVPNTLVSRLLTYGIVAAGLYFFVRLVSAGFTLLSSFGDPAKIQAAQQQLLHALLGLVIVVSTFFIAQILSYVLGLKLGLV